MPRMVLVVDDSSTIQEAVRHALAGEPWEAVSAASGEEAEDKLQSGRFDVVLCDVDLGDEDGFGVCRRIREVSPSRAAPVVLMGARVTPAAAEAAGATATLTKPFSSEELLGALQEAVEMQSFGMDDLELETTEPVAETRKGPSVPPAAEEEVEIIDLSDEEDLSEFELLEDLEPIEVPPSPLEEEPAFGLDDLLSLGDEGEPDGTDAKPLDLDAGGGGSTPASATETEPGEIGDLLASLPADEGAEAAFPLAEADGADEIGDLLESLAPEQGLEPAEDESGPEIPIAPAPAEPSTPAFEGAEPTPTGEAEEPKTEGAEAAPTEEGTLFPETPEAYEEAPTGWEEPGPTPPHRTDWDREAPGGEPTAASLEPMVETTVRQALERSLSPEALTPLVQATVEKVVWEVVPQLAERLIQEAIERLKQEPEGGG
ncbi:response regulator [Deferrisoma camini]|uniref:response regulator n=1 Tax=Deferrisoma camini TaxID=1035120 RepID=UPI00046D1AEF|nr:response regulator [Deferrisoma camini]